MLGNKIQRIAARARFKKANYHIKRVRNFMAFFFFKGYKARNFFVREMCDMHERYITLI